MFAPSTAALGRQRGPERSGGRRRAAILVREEFGGAEGENRWPEPLRARFARLGRTEPRGCAGMRRRLLCVIDRDRIDPEFSRWILAIIG